MFEILHIYVLPPFDNLKPTYLLLLHPYQNLCFLQFCRLLFGSSR